MNMREVTKKPVSPLMIVMASISIIEVAMTIMYPQLKSDWERVPTLITVLVIPIAIITGFIYLWITKPGHLFHPSEFGTGKLAEAKMAAYCKNCLVKYRPVHNNRNNEEEEEEINS